MASTKTTKPKPAAEAPEVDAVEYDTPEVDIPEVDTPAKSTKSTGKRETALLMEVMEDGLPEQASTRGGGVQFATAFATIKSMTEAGDIPWDDTEDKPKWTAVKRYGNHSGARNHIKEMEGTGTGKKATGPKAYAAGFEFADRKFTEANGDKYSILYARYVGV